jgi:hypothetical protein
MKSCRMTGIRRSRLARSDWIGVGNQGSIVICDEHQDSSGDQHAVVMTLLSFESGRKGPDLCRSDAKNIQRQAFVGSSPEYNWAELTGQAQAFEQLDTPHRWTSGCPDLGRWTLKARDQSIFCRDSSSSAPISPWFSAATTSSLALLAE